MDNSEQKCLSAIVVSLSVSLLACLIGSLSLGSAAHRPTAIFVYFVCCLGLTSLALFVCLKLHDRIVRNFVAFWLPAILCVWLYDLIVGAREPWLAMLFYPLMFNLANVLFAKIKHRDPIFFLFA